MCRADGHVDPGDLVLGVLDHDAVLVAVRSHPVQDGGTRSHGVSRGKAAAAGQRAHGEGFGTVHHHARRGIRVGGRPVRVVIRALPALLVSPTDGGEVSVDHLLALAGEIVADHALERGQVETGQACGDAQAEGVARQRGAGLFLGYLAHSEANVLDRIAGQRVGIDLERRVVDDRAALDHAVAMAWDRLLGQCQQ